MRGLRIKTKLHFPFWFHLVALGSFSIISWTSQIWWWINSTFWYQDWYLAYQLIDYTRNSLITFDWQPHVALVDQFSNANSTVGIFGNRIFSIGMLIFSPDALFFPLFETRYALVFHVVFSITLIALCTTLQLKNLGYSIFSIYFLGISFLFFSPFVARISVGHIQLIGYFLVPLFLALLIEVSTLKPKFYSLWRIKMTLLLTYVISLGSIHVFFQMLIILSLYCLFNPSFFRVLSIPPLISLMLTAFQVLPSLLDREGNSNRSVYAGYGYKFYDLTSWRNRESEYSFASLLEIIRTTKLHFAEVVTHIWVAMTDSESAIKFNGWEWTVDIGIILVCIISSYFFLLTSRKTKLGRRDLWVLIPLFLSLSLVYRFTFLALKLFFDFPAIDRVPYRMFIYPLVWIILKSMSYFDSNIFRIWTKNLFLRILLFSMLCFNSLHGFEVLRSWNFKFLLEDIQLQKLAGLTRLPKYQITVQPLDYEYISHIEVGFLISIVTSFFCLIYCRSLFKKV